MDVFSADLGGAIVADGLVVQLDTEDSVIVGSLQLPDDALEVYAAVAQRAEALHGPLGIQRIVGIQVLQVHIANAFAVFPDQTWGVDACQSCVGGIHAQEHVFRVRIGHVQINGPNEED